MKKISGALVVAVSTMLVIGMASCALDLFGTKGDSELFVDIPGRYFAMMKTEVTQKMYETVMGSNPSYNRGDENPVEQVSWYDAIYFCNKLSVRNGKTPVYSVDGKTDVSTWGYKPHNENRIYGSIEQNLNADGYRLPTDEEWEYAAKGGENYIYSGSDNLDEVGWYDGNSGNKTHPVAQKKANGYGLYDMTGNVFEWCWDVYAYNDYYGRYVRGGSYNTPNYYDGVNLCEVSSSGGWKAHYQLNFVGFRIVCSASN